MLSQNLLKEYYVYNPDTGNFTIKKRSGPQSPEVGSVVRTRHSYVDPYIVVRLGGKQYKAHRLAWLYVYGYTPKEDIDHMNGIKNDNRLVNLRLATRSDNRANTSIQHNNTSGFKGVSLFEPENGRPTRWVGYVSYNRVRHHVGIFQSLEDAVEAVRLKRSELHGCFANHG